jgi:hypothetical protein
LDIYITLLARVREGYDGCLCTTCLAQLRAATPTPE